MRYSELIENTDSDDDLFAKPLVDRIRARLAELEDQDMMEPDDMIDTVAEEFNLEVEQVYDLLDDEVYENTDDDDDLFGGRDRGSPTAEKAVAKFKMAFPVNKRVSWSKMHFDTVERLFDLTRDSRFTAGESVNRHSYWATSAYTNRQSGLGMLVYEESSAGTWVYLGANDRNDFANMIQQMIEAGQLEDPEAAKKRRVEKQQRRAATIEKKGLRVGSIVDIGNGITAEVIEIKPTTGKVVMKDITGNRIGTERIYSAYQISKRMIMSENDDDDLFAEPRSYMFVVVAPDNEILSNYTRVEDAIARARAEVDDYRELGYEDDDAITVVRYKEEENEINFDDPGVTVAVVSLGSGELRENFDDNDDLFATPKIAFNDVFNEYDEDELMAQGFQYGDHPEQDIEILNNYLEDYKDFRVVDISGGEHDLILHLDRSSRLRETDDDLFGTTSFNADRAGKLIATANITSGELVDPESIQHALEHAANRVMNSPVVQKKAADQLQKWMAMDNDAQWELVDEIANVVYDINGDGWEPEEDPYYDRANESADDDNELFGKKWHENINRRSIEIDGVDSSDYPDFADAHIVYAETQDGKPLTDEQLDQLNDMYHDSGELNELVWDSLHEDRHAL